MKITFNPAKDAINQEKHGVSLSDGTRLEWDTALFWPDTRKDYGEDRVSGLVLIGTRLYCVVFTDRGEMRRIISRAKRTIER